MKHSNNNNILSCLGGAPVIVCNMSMYKEQRAQKGAFNKRAVNGVFRSLPESKDSSLGLSRARVELSIDIVP